VIERKLPSWWRRLSDRQLIVRYLLAGLASAATHASVLVGLVELVALRPVIASSVGFVAGLGVSFALQHRWVYASSRTAWETGPRFLLITGGAFAVNLITMSLGVALARDRYLLVQVIAFILIPLSNYTLNTLWTFAARGGPR
jgi:putative flippase GtrA